MLHIRVAEFFGGFGRGLVGLALRTSAIRNDQCALVLGQNLRQLAFGRGEIDRSGNVPFLYESVPFASRMVTDFDEAAVFRSPIVISG